MTAPTGAGRRLVALIAMGCVAVLAVAAALWWLLLTPSPQHATAYFTSAVGLYPGSDVRVLGIKVGTVDSVTPEGTRVRVELSVDHDVAIPAEVHAVSVAPSLVSDRYVQLAPPYTGGDRMRDGAVIPLERTATPLELDELYASLDRLTTALGPDGANADGALSDFLDVNAEVLDGTGRTINASITELSKAAQTLADSRGDLFATVDNLQKFTAMLAANDAQVRQFTGQLATVSRFLADERHNLGEALDQLAVALGQVSTFVAEHRGALKTNVDKLTEITAMLVAQKADLQEFLDAAPLALGNLANAYNGYAGATETRTNLNELADPSLLLCRAIGRPDAVTSGLLPSLPLDFVEACQTLYDQLGETLGIPSPVDVIHALENGHLPPIPVLTLAERERAEQSGGHR